MIEGARGRRRGEDVAMQANELGAGLTVAKMPAQWREWLPAGGFTVLRAIAVVARRQPAP